MCLLVSNIYRETFLLCSLFEYPHLITTLPHKRRHISPHAAVVNRVRNEGKRLFSESDFHSFFNSFFARFPFNVLGCINIVSWMAVDMPNSRSENSE